MNSNLEHQLTLDGFSLLAKLSKSRMRDLFMAETSTSPGRDLKALRMKKARELLESTSLSVREIRVEVGMQDHSHFARGFKKMCGLTPSQYRAKGLAELDLSNEDLDRE